MISGAYIQEAISTFLEETVGRETSCQTNDREGRSHRSKANLFDSLFSDCQSLTSLSSKE